MKMIIIFLEVFFSFAITICSQGSEIWQKTFDGGYHSDDQGYDICEDGIGNYFIIGTSLTPGLRSNSWIIKVLKIDSSGDTLFTLEFRNNNTIEAHTAIEDTKGGCIVTGKQGTPGIFFLSVNRFGNINWYKSYGNRISELRDIIKTKDGGYVACGWKNNLTIDCIIVKIDSLGNLLWQREIPAVYVKSAYSISEDENKNLLVCGNQVNGAGDTTSAFILQTDSSGNVKWNYNFRISNKLTSAYKLLKTKSGFVVCGETLELPSYKSNVFFVRLNISGNIVYQKEFTSDYIEYSPVLHINNDNEYLFGLSRYFSNSKSITRIFETDSMGIIHRENIISTSYNTNIDLKNIKRSNDSYFYFTGTYYRELGPTRNDFYVLKTDSLLSIPVSIKENAIEITPDNFLIAFAYPNPFNPELNIKYKILTKCFLQLKIFDAVGKCISVLRNSIVAPGDYTVKYKSQFIPSGIYYLSFIINNKMNKSFKVACIK